MRLSCIVLICCLIKTSESWDADDLALFDVVEDVGKNFYELLDVDQAASSTEIRRAYRRVSLQLHPDKNKDPDAENQFRKLVAAYEILKDEKMREKYNEVLVTGLPDWRQPVYYYRKVKKMGLIESSILLSIILTIGHFLVSWSIYLEKKFVYEQLSRSKRKKDKKSRKQRTEEVENDSTQSEEMEQLIPKPKFSDLLPILMFKGCCWMVSKTPCLFLHFVDSVKTWKHGRSEGNPDDSGDDDDDSDEQAKIRIRRQRPASNFTYELAEPTEVVSTTRTLDASSNQNNDESYKESTSQKSGEWTEAEIELLVKAIVKFPGGTAERWEKISAMVGRSVREVTNMSQRLKTNNAGALSEMNNKVLTKRAADGLLKNIELTTSDAGQAQTQLPKQQKLSPNVVNPTSNSRQTLERTLATSKNQTKVVQSSNPASPVWTQNHQKLLEAAMTQIPKDDPERWDKIANLVPGKSKEECLQRVRHLAEMVKRRKLEQAEATTTIRESK